MAIDDFQNIMSLYSACKVQRDRQKPLWDDIARYVGIQVETQYAYNNNQDQSQQLDEFVDDPTSAIAVNQFGDYMFGIMWGDGTNVVDVVPSRYVKEKLGKDNEDGLNDYYDYATDQTLYHFNHSDSGYTTALRPYIYDQAAFGTSGIGIFKNDDFINGISDNALIATNYGVDNIVIDEGKSGLVEICFATYRWKVNRIVGTFCQVKGEISQDLVAKLPRAIMMAYTKGDYTREFPIVFGFFPRSDFNPKLKGKRGTKYRGVWFQEDNPTNVFFEEDFTERPISVARMIKIRGEIFGRSSGTMLISTIRSVNFMLGEVIEIIEKMGNPSLGIWSNAIFGDDVLDTSPNGLTVFNAALGGGDMSKPAFPLYDIGDPAETIKFLIPYLNEKITTAFHIDALLDFNTEKDMTATESLQRYNIRGKSLASMLLQQKNERMIPDFRRGISLLMEMGELGTNPKTQEMKAKKLQSLNRGERIIPAEVLETIAEGKPWYELKFNNELEKLTRTQTVQNLIQMLQTVTAIAGVYPDIVEAVDWYGFLKDINANLDANNKLVYDAKTFKAKITQLAASRQQAQQLQNMQNSSQVNSNNAQAGLSNAKATQVQNGQTVA